MYAHSISPSKCEYFHQVWQKGRDLKDSKFLKMFIKLGKLIERYMSSLQLKEQMWLSHLHQPLTSQHWHKKPEKTKLNPFHHSWSCQLFNVPVRCKNAGEVIPALTDYGTGFLWSFTKCFIFRTTRRGWVHCGAERIKMSFTLQREFQKRNISPGVLQNNVRQAQLSETQLPASLNSICKSQRSS